MARSSTSTTRKCRRRWRPTRSPWRATPNTNPLPTCCPPSSTSCPRRASLTSRWCPFFSRIITLAVESFTEQIPFQNLKSTTRQRWPATTGDGHGLMQRFHFYFLPQFQERIVGASAAGGGRDDASAAAGAAAAARRRLLPARHGRRFGLPRRHFFLGRRLSRRRQRRRAAVRGARLVPARRPLARRLGLGRTVGADRRRRRHHFQRAILGLFGDLATHLHTQRPIFFIQHYAPHVMIFQWHCKTMNVKCHLWWDDTNNWLEYYTISEKMKWNRGRTSWSSARSWFSRMMAAYVLELTSGVFPPAHRTEKDTEKLAGGIKDSNWKR